MKPFDPQKQMSERWKEVKLSESSRVRIEKELMEYARFHTVEEGVSGAVRDAGESRSIERIPHGILSFIQLSNWKLKPMTALILIALLAGGSTSFAAERAVPGDALYGMKVEVNEEVMSMFALTNRSEAELQARLMDERLEEAETLAARGELTKEAAVDLSARMKAHMAEASERSRDAEAAGDFETAATVRASLDATLHSYATVLANVKGENAGVANLISELNALSTATAGTETSARFEAGADADMQASVEATIQAAASILKKAQAEFNDAKADLSASAKASVEARLQSAAEAYAEAEASFRAEAYAAAYEAAETALRLGGEVRTMIESALRVDIDLDTNVDSIFDIDLGTDDGSADGSVEADAEADTDASLDTDIVDTEVKTNTTIQSGATLGL